MARSNTGDHLYLCPDGLRLDGSAEAAAAIGLRLHAACGSLCVGETDGALS